MIVAGVLLIVIGAALVVVPELARLAPLGWLLVVIGIALVVLYAVEGYALMTGDVP